MQKYRHGSVGMFTALLAGVAIYGFAMGTSYPLLGILLADRVSDAWNGVSVMATGLGLVAGVIVTPSCTYRFGAGYTAIAGIILMAGALFLLSTEPTFWVIFSARILLGIGANLMFVVTETGLNVLSDPRSRGQLLGMYTMLNGIGFVLGPALVAYAPDYPVYLLQACAACAILAVGPFLSVASTLNNRIVPAEKARYWETIGTLPFAFVLLFVASAADAIVIGFLPVIGMRSGFSVAQGAMFVAIFHIGLVCGQPIVGWLLDNWGRRPTVVACLSLSLAATAMLIFGTSLYFPLTGVFLFVWGAANYGLYTAGLTLVGDQFEGAALSAATGSFALVYALAATIAPVLSGLGLQAFNASGFYTLASCIYFVAAVWAVARFWPWEPKLEPNMPNTEKSE